MLRHDQVAEEVRDLADDLDEVHWTQGQRALEGVVEKPADDQDADDAGREARSDGDDCRPELDSVVTTQTASA